MKAGMIAFFAFDAVVLGVVLGVVLTFSEFSGDEGAQAFASARAEGTSVESSGSDNFPGGEPRLQVVGLPDYDFGVMEKGESGTHTFEIKNVGDATLTLKKPQTTCKCTVSEAKDERVEPGGKTQVTLNWTPPAFTPEFRQSATFQTNDPKHKRLQLQIHGQVIQTVRAAPDNILLSNVSANEQHTAEVHVYCYRTEDFELEFDRFDKPQLADDFNVEIKPLSAEEVALEPNAKAGFKVTVTLKAGLPVGPISQKLFFKSNLDVPDLEVPIHGAVSGDIVVLASGRLYDSQRRIVTIGGVPQATGGEYSLHLLVKAPHAEETKLSLGEVDPAGVLEVEIDTENPSKLGSGLLYPMTIRIPPGSPLVSRLGTATDQDNRKFGRIVIKTTHPVTKEVLLYVKFAVGD